MFIAILFTVHFWVDFKGYIFFIFVASFISVVFNYNVYGYSIDFFNLLFLFFILISVSFIDLKLYIIPNKLIILGFIYIFIYNLILSFLYKDIYYIINLFINLSISGLPILFLIVIFKGSLGAGDMKLTSIIGSFLGYKTSFVIIIISFMIASVFSIVSIILKRLSLKSKVPLAPFIAVSTFLTCFFIEEISHFLAVYYNVHI